MITPFYLAILLPVMFLQSPGLEFTMGLACIPVVNVAMMVREAITATFHWPQIALTLAVSAATIAAGLSAAGFILQFEDVVTGSFTGGPGRFLRERVLRRRTAADPMEGRA